MSTVSEGNGDLIGNGQGRVVILVISETIEEKFSTVARGDRQLT